MFQELTKNTVMKIIGTVFTFWSKQASSAQKRRVNHLK